MAVGSGGSGVGRGVLSNELPGVASQVGCNIDTRDEAKRSTVWYNVGKLPFKTCTTHTYMPPTALSLDHETI